MKITCDETQNKPWLRSWINPHKKQRRLRFATEREAEDYIDPNEVDVKRLGTDLAALTKGEKQSALLATTLCQDHHVNLVDAVRYYIERTGVKEDILLSEAFGQFQGTLKGYRKRTVTSLCGSLRSYLYQNDRMAREVSRNDVLEYLLGMNCGTQTQRNHYMRLNRFFNWLKREKYILENPCSEIIPNEDIGKLPRRTIAIFTVDEVERVLVTAQQHDPGLLPFLALGFFAGLRPSEITGGDGKPGITWDDIFMDADELPEVLVPSNSSKTDEPRQVELSANALAWLKLGGDLPPKNFNKRRQVIAAIAKVEWPPDIMRHSFASHHCAWYRQPERLKLELGHSKNSQTLFNHYRSGRVKRGEAKRFWNISPAPLDTGRSSGTY